MRIHTEMIEGSAMRERTTIETQHDGSLSIGAVDVYGVPAVDVAITHFDGGRRHRLTIEEARALASVLVGMIERYGKV